MTEEDAINEILKRMDGLEKDFESLLEADIDTTEIEALIDRLDDRLLKRINALEANLAAKELEIRSLMDRTDGAVMINSTVLTQAVASELVRRMTRLKTVRRTAVID